MKIGKLFYPFYEIGKKLNKKWWHRMFIVFYLVVMPIIFLLLILIFIEIIPLNKHLLSIDNSLNHYTKYTFYTDNDSVKSFVKKYDHIGCLEKSKVRYVSSWTLENKSFCSKDIRSNLDEVMIKLLGGSKALNEENRQKLTEILDKDTEKRYCFIHEDINCNSEQIVGYKKNVFFYFLAILGSTLSLFLLNLLFQLLYFKGFIYVIYGNSIKNSK